jgi:hypothetical protein
MLKQHHIEASLDFFNVLQQMVSLAPGLRLVYRTNFAGMYNDISQVHLFNAPRSACACYLLTSFYRWFIFISPNLPGSLSFH